jgi:hypothetical protein
MRPSHANTISGDIVTIINSDEEENIEELTESSEVNNLLKIL